MSIAENKAVARQFFERFSASDIDGALATTADDTTWWIPGRKERSPSAGLYTKDKIGRPVPLPTVTRFDGTHCFRQDGFEFFIDRLDACLQRQMSGRWLPK